MTSLYPSATGVWHDFDFLHSDYLTLAEILRSQGFATASFIQNVNAGFSVGLHQGFGTLFDLETVGIRAEQLYDSPELRQWIESNSKRNIFLYLHLLDPHGPYGPLYPPEEFIQHVDDLLSADVDTLEKNPLYDPAWLRIPSIQSRNAFYDEEVRYNDSQFPDLIKLLKDHGMWENTVMVMMADHGEYLGEHDLWGHWAPGYRQVIHVPLVFLSSKQLFPNRRVERSVQLLDLMPTLLELAGIPRDGLLIAGNSLVPQLKGEEVSSTGERLAVSEEVRFRKRDDGVACGSVFWKDHHILTSDAIDDPLYGKNPGLFHRIAGTEVPTRVFSQTRNFDEDAVDIAYGLDLWLQHRMARFFRQFKQKNMVIWNDVTKATAVEAEIDPETVDQLRTLGYIR
jgi:hypothetical protein